VFASCNPKINWDQHIRNEILKQIQERMSLFPDVRIVFTSNVTKYRIFKSLELALGAYENKVRKIPTSKLNGALL
jgi:GTP-binding protein